MSINSIGIDLGTTFSVVGIFKNGNVEILANKQGSRTTPSLVSFNDEVRKIGTTAKQQVDLNPVNSISNVKRLIGQKYNYPGVQKDIKQWQHKVICENGNTPMFEVQYLNERKVFAPEQISAMILGNIKETAENFLGHTVKNAVITVPAYFNDSQRQATRDAGEIAGFNVLALLNEPTAAAIAYGFDKKGGKKTILVFDLGGGTFDVTILSIDNGSFKVRWTSGDVHLGGEDFDDLLVEYFVKDIKTTHKIDISKDPKAHRRLRTACEEAKRYLSSETNATITLATLFNNRDYEKTINRSRFETMCSELFNRTLEIVKEALKESKIDKNEIDDVVLVGGSTRIPRIQKLLSDFFNGKQLTQSINPDEAVAYGATIYAAMLVKDQSEQIKNLTLSDVTPLSLGVEVDGRSMSTIISRNTTVPTRHTKKFVTSTDDQEAASIKVYEGEGGNSVDNNLLGEFELVGIAKAAKGVSKIDVTFGITVDGILEVTAVDTTNGSQNSSRIDKKKGRLSKEKIKQMIADEKGLQDEIVERMETTVSRDKLENIISDVSEYLERDEMSQMSATQKRSVVNAHCAISEWFGNRGGTASKKELEDRYKTFKSEVESTTGEKF